MKSVQNMWSPNYQSSSLEFYRDLFPWAGPHGTLSSLNIYVPTSTGLPDGLHPTPPMGWTSWNTFFQYNSEEKMISQVYFFTLYPRYMVRKNESGKIRSAWPLILYSLYTACSSALTTSKFRTYP